MILLPNQLAKDSNLAPKGRLQTDHHRTQKATDRILPLITLVSDLTTCHIHAQTNPSGLADGKNMAENQLVKRQTS